jgi:oxygen-independent coproporphyrinogen-3 oxidase
MPIQYDINLLRFLTANTPMSIEDFIIRPLFKNMAFDNIKIYIKKYIKSGYPYYNPRKLNIYIHIPYCNRICTYCHCRRIQLSSHKELLEYVDFIISQIRTFGSLFKKSEMNSLCFGGGTPSLLDAKSIERVFNELFGKFNFKHNKINFEANPSSLTLDKLKLLKKYNAHRISLGIQTFDDEVLKEINRYQPRHNVYQCIENIKKLKFPYLNVDLIPGLPHQTIESFLKDIKILIKFKVDLIHINPFSDILSSAYYQRRNLNIYELIKTRHTMISEAKKILKGNGYKRWGFEAYQLTKGGEDYQESSYTEYPGSVLGLGIFAKSNLAGQLVFENLPKNKKFTSCIFSGYPIDERYTMAHYVILHLLKGLRQTSFYNIFKKELTNIFKEELSFLKDIKFISENDGVYRYAGPWSVEGLFDYFSYTKIFFGKDIISDLKTKYRGRYIPSRDYSFKNNSVKIFQDLWIMNMYYDIGL